MDPRDRADAALARAQARGGFVVTPDNAISPMDTASTVQIPRGVVAAADPQNDPETTLIISPIISPIPGGPPWHPSAQQPPPPWPHPGPPHNQHPGQYPGPPHNQQPGQHPGAQQPPQPHPGPPHNPQPGQHPGPPHNQQPGARPGQLPHPPAQRPDARWG
jgi:hypothetical protein